MRSKQRSNGDAIDVDTIVKAQSAWKRRYQEAQADADSLRAELDAILHLDSRDLEPIRVEGGAGGCDGEATAMLVLSDIHAFERVKRTEVNGLNEYNADIAAKSIATAFEKGLLLTEIERSATHVPHIVVALLGDLMTNQLHEDQLETNEGTVQEEMLFLLERLVGGFDFLLDEGKFESILVPCCDGNHGRDTDRIRSANRVKHSHEWLLYCLLAKHYAKEPRIRFSIADGMLHYLGLYGKTVRFTHGDRIKYQGGIGGLTIPARKAIKEWDSGVRADFTVFAHFHTSILDKMFMSNGSMLGYAAYAQTIKAPFEPPTQSFALFGSRPDKWLLGYRPIYVR